CERAECRGAETIDALNAKTPAILAGASGILSKGILETLDVAIPSLNNLDWIISRCRTHENDQRRLAVPSRPSASSTGVEIALDVKPAGIRMMTHQNGRHLIGIGSCWNAFRDCTGERPQTQLDQKIYRYVIAGGRRRLTRRDHRSR